MESNPRHSPPSNAPLIVPVFPLPNVYLFPGCVMPLHIFEPRYRQMIEDLLDRPGRLVLGTLLEGELDAAGNPAVLDVGGLGEIGRHEKLPDGRYLIWMFGLSRVRLREVSTSHAYRLVAIEPLIEIEANAQRAPLLRERVQAALLARTPDFLNMPEGVPLSHMVDLLSQRIQLPSSVMQEIFCEADVAARADRALAEHDRRPVPPAS
ncbi:MAG: LON peptidase substrate-binding domain-containing protein [Planctomycetes bacterium]|nr:LON peptidase substrate-binding domain-containing protein [Planctomycetota bacterium]